MPPELEVLAEFCEMQEEGLLADACPLQADSGEIDVTPLFCTVLVTLSGMPFDDLPAAVERGAIMLHAGDITSDEVTAAMARILAVMVTGSERLRRIVQSN